MFRNGAFFFCVIGAGRLGFEGSAEGTFAPRSALGEHITLLVKYNVLYFIKSFPPFRSLGGGGFL